MERNEPTTAEIVATLTQIIDQFSEAYLFGDLSEQATEALDPFVQARDRLEQLERERVRITDELTAMTDRAEKAEAERDAAEMLLSKLHDSYRISEFAEEAIEKYFLSKQRGKENDGKD